MTLQEAKDQATDKITGGEYRNFDILLDHASGGIVGAHVLIAAIEIAADLYARSKWDDACEAQRQELVKLFDKSSGTLSGYYTMKELHKPEFKP